MSNADGNEIVRFDPNYRLRPFPGIGARGFAEADAKANAFFVCLLADFDEEVLEFIASRLPPLAVNIVNWNHAELNRARTKSPSSTVIDESAEARLADDGRRLCR
jgi:hypothetical protein